jgi:hypothetical protein
MPPRYGGRHQADRARALARLHDGDPCARCGGGMFRAEARFLDLDHDESGGYLGLSHRSCNRRAGRLKAAANSAARKPRKAPQCAVCGIGISPSSAEVATCGRSPCVAELRRLRRAGEGTPSPPPASGRVWLPACAVPGPYRASQGHRIGGEVIADTEVVQGGPRVRRGPLIVGLLGQVSRCPGLGDHPAEGALILPRYRVSRPRSCSIQLR